MAFVVTAGQIAAIQRADYRRGAPWWGGNVSRAVTLAPDVTMTYRQIWRTQPQLRTVVSFLARNVAQLGLDVYRRVSDTDRVKARDHPVARMLERPLPDSNLTKYRLMNTVMHDLCIYDNAFLIKQRYDGGGLGLMPVSPVYVQPIGSTWAPAEQYRIQGDKDALTLDAEDVVHVYGYNPDDTREGASPIEALRQILAEEHAATMYREQLWRNGARIAGYLKRPADSPRWSDPARDRFAASWQAQYAGNGPQSGGTPILEDGMDFVASGVSPKDAQYVESRRLTREEAAVAYHLSPSMVGMTEGTNFSSIQEIHRMLYQDTLAPYLVQIAQDFENQILHDVDPTSRDGSTYIEFNLAEKLRGDFAEQTSALQSAVGGPWMSRNEARAVQNLAAMPDADDLIVPLNVTVGGLAAPNDTAPHNPSTEGNPKRGHVVHLEARRESEECACQAEFRRDRRR